MTPLKIFTKNNGRTRRDLRGFQKKTGVSVTYNLCGAGFLNSLQPSRLRSN